MKIIGIDEVGYGAWAGPLMTCAVHIDIPNFFSNDVNELVNRSNDYIKSIVDEDHFNLIKDSKKLSVPKRQHMYEFLTKNFNFSIGSIQNKEIDDINIRNANFKAMERAVTALQMNYDIIIIDGNAKPTFSEKIITIVDGDDFSKLISIASIIAKVTRDTEMQQLHNEFPNYGWDKNVGYGTKLHSDGLKTFGVTKYHRISYKPVKALL